jgi:hypothetical protein
MIVPELKSVDPPSPEVVMVEWLPVFMLVYPVLIPEIVEPPAA